MYPGFFNRRHDWSRQPGSNWSAKWETQITRMQYSGRTVESRWRGETRTSWRRILSCIILRQAVGSRRFDGLRQAPLLNNSKLPQILHGSGLRSFTLCVALCQMNPAQTLAFLSAREGGVAAECLLRVPWVVYHARNVANTGNISSEKYGLREMNCWCRTE